MTRPPIFAQDLVETGLLDSLATAVASGIATIERSVEDHPWIWIGAITICLVLLLRPRR